MKLVNLVIKSEEVPASKGYTTAASIIISRHLPDIYAALLQLAYAPLSAYAPLEPLNKAISHNAIPASPANMSPAVSSKVTPGISRQEKDKSARVFMWLFERSDSYRAMESLMLLLGTSPLHPVPAWLRGICGRFLSRILLRPNGVSIVLDFTVGDADQVQFGQLEKISKLILSVPQQMPSVESYYAVIAPQLLVLLETIVRNSQQKSPRAQAITFVIGRMIIKHTNLAKKYIVDQIVGSLLTHWNSQEYATTDTVGGLDVQAMAEEDLRTVLYTLHCVMVGGEPSPVVIQSFLAGSIPMLYHLYEFSTRSKSNLREIVLDLLTTYFRITTTREAIGDLKRILLDKADLSNSRVAYFGPGPTGGVVLRLRRHIGNRFPKQASSNQLSIDPKVMVEFLQGIDSPDLCGDFFVTNAILNILASALMMLHLIMGMLDNLGPEILKNPTQIVAFASNVVTEHADRLTKPKSLAREQQQQSRGFADFANIVSHEDRETIEDMHDETYTANDDFESLLLAIHLMRAVIHENEDLGPQTVQLLESGLGPLRTVEKYGGEEVQDPVHEVILAITSHLSAQRMAGPKSDGQEDSRTKYREAMKALQDDLLPVRAHGIGMLKEMVLSRDPLVASGSGLDNVLDLFVRLVQDEDSFIYLNAVKGLSALTDVHGNAIIAKLGEIYSDESQKLENRLRVGEALLQTVQRCGDALGKYGNMNRVKRNRPYMYNLFLLLLFFIYILYIYYIYIILYIDSLDSCSTSGNSIGQTWGR
ncbi:hypothetical protein CLU79DRAFT_710972 [Phycomyces nitens]|nr:hypothetical protein CLU79DRAFT_710972 [Phycomyces nitens]